VKVREIKSGKVYKVRKAMKNDKDETIFLIFNGESWNWYRANLFTSAKE